MLLQKKGKELKLRAKWAEEKAEKEAGFKPKRKKVPVEDRLMRLEGRRERHEQKKK